MEESSSRPAKAPADVNAFTLGRLAVGITIVLLLAFGAILGLSKLLSGGGATQTMLYVQSGKLIAQPLTEDSPKAPLAEVGERTVFGIVNYATVLDGEIVSRRIGPEPGERRVGRGVPLQFSLSGSVLIRRADSTIESVSDSGTVSWGRGDDPVFVGEGVAMIRGGKLEVGTSDGDEVKFRDLGRYDRAWASSPDGRQILASKGSRLDIVEVATGEAHDSGFTGSITGVGVSERGVVAVAGTRKSERGVFLLSSEGPAKLLVGGAAEHLAFTPDENALAVTNQGRIVVYNTTSAKVIASATSDASSEVAILWMR